MSCSSSTRPPGLPGSRDGVQPASLWGGFDCLDLIQPCIFPGERLKQGRVARTMALGEFLPTEAEAHLKMSRQAYCQPSAEQHRLPTFKSLFFSAVFSFRASKTGFLCPPPPPQPLWGQNGSFVIIDFKIFHLREKRYCRHGENAKLFKEEKNLKAHKIPPLLTLSCVVFQFFLVSDVKIALLNQFYVCFLHYVSLFF